MSEANDPNGCEVIPKPGDYDETTIAASSATNLTTTNTATSTTTSTTTTNSAPSAPIPPATFAAFRLPDGRIMDSKNTLQSFDAAAAASVRPSHPTPPQEMQPPKILANNNSNTNANANGHNPNENFIICAQAVPVHDTSTIIAEGELFDPQMYIASLTAPPPVPPSTAPSTPTEHGTPTEHDHLQPEANNKLSAEQQQQPKRNKCCKYTAFGCASVFIVGLIILILAVVSYGSGSDTGSISSGSGISSSAPIMTFGSSSSIVSITVSIAATVFALLL